MTFPLSITLHDPTNQPIAGATVIISPETVNPTDEGTVLSTVRGTTNANGELIFDLLPSTAGTYYIMHINLGTTQDIIEPFRFQMPAAATTYSALLASAIANKQPIPEGVIVDVPGQPFTEPDFAHLTDVTIPVADAAYQFGDWVDVYHLTNTGSTAVYVAVFDLTFDPDWAYAADDRAEVDVRIRHMSADDMLIRELEHHNYEYIRNLDVSHSQGTVEATAIDELETGEYFEVDVRVGRQQPLSARADDRTVKMIGAQSTVQWKRDNVITPKTIRVTVDPTTMAGTGSTASPIRPLVPYSQAEKDKLDAIPANASAPQTREQIRDKLESFTQETDRLDAQLALKNLPNPTIPSSISDLSDVELTNPAQGDTLSWDASQRELVNVQPHQALDGAAIIDIIQNRPPSQRLDRQYLRGQTTVEGSTALPAVADVPNFTLYVKQDSSADNPGLYLAGATYDVPVRDRNRAIITPDSTGEFFLGQRGRVVDNYDNVIGQYIGRPVGAGRATLGLAIYFGADTPVHTPPATIYVRGINGSNAPRAMPRLTTSTEPSGTFITIQGKRYAEYADVVPTSAVDRFDELEQTLTFFTNAAGSLPLNIKPAVEHKSRTWHLQSPVPPDFAITDPQSPAFIKNKPSTSSIGRTIAVSSALPTALTALQRRGTTSISSYLPSLSAGVVTTGYVVSANTIECAQPYPESMIGFYARALTESSELCRLFIPLTTILTHADLSTILSPTRSASHAYMGEFGGLYCYLAYQSSSGAQPRHGQAGTTGHDIELFVVTPNQPASVSFPANTTIQLTEAIIA